MIREKEELKYLLRGMPRSPRQRNGLFEADCEIIRAGSRYLAVSTDSIGEEITMGLYRDPFLWGWLTVMSSVSDLAASGTRPLGLLLSTQWAFGTTKRIQREVYRGVRAALKTSRVPLLGGDSGGAKDHVFTSTILGESEEPPLSRRGARPGDLVFLFGRKALGAGPALAARFLAGAPASVFPEKKFRPTPSWEKVADVRGSLSAAVDTSDGLATGLAILSELNDVSFRLKWRPESLDPAAARACRRMNLPLPFLWMSDLGDLQVLATARPSQGATLRRRRDLLEIGLVVSRARPSTLEMNGKTFELPLNWVTESGRDLSSIRRLQKRLTDYFQKEMR